jgi:hypothetical protein
MLSLPGDEAAKQSSNQGVANVPGCLGFQPENKSE